MRGGAACLIGLTLSSRAAFAARLFPDGVEDRYKLFRDEREIGAQVFTFERQTGQFVVSCAIDARYRAADGSEVLYQQQSREVWRAGKVHSIEASTRIADEAYPVDGVQTERGFETSSRYFPRRVYVVGYFVPSSLWHRDTRFVRFMFDLKDGYIKIIRPLWLGVERLRVGDREVETQRYQIRGEVDRDMWYGPDCELVRIGAPLPDGSWMYAQLQG